MAEAAARYKRVILKISGEGLCESGGFGLHPEPLSRIADELVSVTELGVRVGVVVGGGNFMRGASFSQMLGIDVAVADYMGMLATVLNGLALREILEQRGQPARVQSAFLIRRVCEPFTRRRALAHLEKGRVVILAGGTGNPHVTTDTCAALRAAELKADAVLKATKVAGVYDSDPEVNPDAKLFDRLNYDEVINRRLKVMDLSAIDVCQQHDVPIIVFNMFEAGVMRRAVLGEKLGTLVGT